MGTDMRWHSVQALRGQTWCAEFTAPSMPRLPSSADEMLVIQSTEKLSILGRGWHEPSLCACERVYVRES